MPHIGNNRAGIEIIGEMQDIRDPIELQMPRIHVLSRTIRLFPVGVKYVI
jgi:hypothetical protein